MALTQSQKALIQKARAAGGGELGAGLSDEACSFLAATIVRDLGLEIEFPELPADLPDFFSASHPRDLELTGPDFMRLLGKLVRLAPDADTYFACLAALHKARLKYARILEHQPIPTMDQVGARALLQYGQMHPKRLAGFLLWRKWLFDIDNRAGQETGYLFEPIIASAIGGSPFSPRQSPVRRAADKQKGRQVDCVRGNFAYEIKIRVTIAASGQGRWKEELEFPADCRHSGFKPILLVLDPTPNPKLSELAAAFQDQGGAAYVGDEAWQHLDEAAGGTMAVFMKKYVRQPLSEMMRHSLDALPEIRFKMGKTGFVLEVEGKTREYPRTTSKNRRWLKRGRH